MGTRPQYLGSQMLLPRRAGFVSSVTADGDESWEARGLSREREQATGRAFPFQEWLYPKAADFRAKISNLQITIEFLHGLAEVRVIFKIQGATLPVKPRPELFSHQAPSSSRTSPWLDPRDLLNAHPAWHCSSFPSALPARRQPQSEQGDHVSIPSQLRAPTPLSQRPAGEHFQESWQGKA